MKDDERSNEDNLIDCARETFLTHPLGGLMVKNILPAVASMLFMSLYQIVDGILVGRRLGPEAMASLNILYPILALLTGLAIMIGVGGNAKIAVLLGKGETHQARGILSLLTILGIVLGVGGSVITALALPQILSFLGTSGTLGDYAGEYLGTLYFFYTPMILFFILEQSTRNDGRPNVATAVMVSVAVLNMLLDYLFLFPLNMGIAGAALATGIAQTIGATIFLGIFFYKTIKRASGLRLGSTNGCWHTIGGIAMNGSSELFTSLALGLTTFLYNRLILSYVGAMGVAAFTLIQYLLMICTTIFIGMGNGTQPIISYNHGAGLSHRVQGAMKRLLASSLVIGVISFLFFQWRMEVLVAVFIPDHMEAQKLTMAVGKYISWSVVFMPVGIIGSVYFTALEEVRKSLVVAVSRSFIFTLIGLGIFPLLWGQMGIWITPVFAEAVTVLVTVLLIGQWGEKLQHLDLF